MSKKVVSNHKGFLPVVNSCHINVYPIRTNRVCCFLIYVTEMWKEK